MCECTMIADGVYTPIKIDSNIMQWVITDKKGKEHVLIDEFVMKIKMTKASVKEIKRKGIVVGYQFNIEQENEMINFFKRLFGYSEVIKPTYEMMFWQGENGYHDGDWGRR